MHATCHMGQVKGAIATHPFHCKKGMSPGKPHLRAPAGYHAHMQGPIGPWNHTHVLNIIPPVSKKYKTVDMNNISTWNHRCCRSCLAVARLGDSMTSIKVIMSLAASVTTSHSLASKEKAPVSEGGWGGWGGMRE